MREDDIIYFSPMAADRLSKDGFYIRFKPLIISRARIKASQKQQMRTIARNVILRVGASSTWLDIQKSLFDGTLENTIKDEVAKIQPVKNLLFITTVDSTT